MTAYLFDTDALSELVKPRPSPAFVEWLRSIDRAVQFTSATVIGELYYGAHRSGQAERHLRNIEEKLLPRVTVLPYDLGVAMKFGQLRAKLEGQGKPLPDADLQIAAAAIAYNLELVTGNVRHFERIDGLRINPILRA